jgi:hypothetical protein
MGKAMHKLVKILADRTAQQQEHQEHLQHLPESPSTRRTQEVLPPLDPSQLTFARTVYLFQMLPHIMTGFHHEETNIMLPAPDDCR